MRIYQVLFLFLFASNITLANDLSQIQQKITQQQNRINEQKKKKEALQSTLKAQEMQIGKVSSELQRIELNLGEIRKTIQHTEREIGRLEKLEREQKDKLKEQLDSAFRSGINPSVVELLLSENAKNADRMTAYYEHINQIRIDTINEIHRTQSELKQKKEQLIIQQKGQQNQLAEQRKQEKELKKVKSERENTLRSIDKNLETDQQRLAALKSNEIALRNKLTQISKESEQQEKQAIAKLEQQKHSEEKRKATEQEKQQIRAGNGLSGKYAMPVNGKILHRFGSTQMGEIKWSSVVIQAAAGSPVRSITSGKVALAGWLDGYGFMVVVDHGKGDISLYGYNQSIAVQKGERVQAGQTIAYVGNTGGQNRASLYFAIRRKGVAVNPLKWVN